MAAQARTTVVKTSSTVTHRKKDNTSQAAMSKLEELQKDCDELKAKLKASEERVAELEMLLKNTINRIDWTIDSLQSLTTDDR